MLKYQNKELLNDMLKRNYYHPFRYLGNKKSLYFVAGTGEVNTCTCGTYSYINEMSPNITTNFYQIPHNLEMLIDWYKSKNFQCDIHIKNFDNIIKYGITDAVFNAFYDKFKENAFTHPRVIYIYSNMNWLMDEVKTQTILDYIEKFAQIKINLEFKVLINGYYCDDDKYTDEFYEKLIQFIIKYSCEVQAQITPDNVENWIQNYKWWVSVLDAWAFVKVKLIENKNINWTKDKISYYISFLDFQIDFLKDNMPNFIRLAFSKETDICFTTVRLYDQGIIDNSSYYQDCDLFNGLHIDLTNLNLILCPRLNYKDFIIGHQNPNAEKIEDWEPDKVELLLISTHLKRSSTPHCELCNSIGFCDGFCLGESFSKILNPLIPVKEGCDFSISKYSFLLYKYKKINYLIPEIIVGLPFTENFKNNYLTPILKNMEDMK